ncbi:hypothetical protein D3C87_955330 [compost metagenome]
MKEWEILEDTEQDYVWQFIHKNFEFHPRYNRNDTSIPFLKLPKPYHIYDMHLFTAYLKDNSVTTDEDFYNTFDQIITSIFIKCMGTSEFIYALDWQHTCFKYNPKSPEKMPRELEMEDFKVYLPDFYPDGDYYFFIASDFSWGYFTHRWVQELWLFGEKLLSEIKNVPSIYLTLKSR